MTGVKVWTEKEMAELIDGMKPKTLIKPLNRLWDRQTAVEQETHETKDHNGVGFNAYDAPFAGRMIESFAKYKNFTPKMAAAIKKMLKKYRKQLVQIANQVEQERGPRKEAKPEPKLEAKRPLVKREFKMGWSEGQPVLVPAERCR